MKLTVKIFIILFYCVNESVVHCNKTELNFEYFLPSDGTNYVDYNGLLSVPCIYNLILHYSQSGEVLRGKTTIISVMLNPPKIQRFFLKIISENGKMSLMLKHSQKPHYSAAKFLEKAKVYVMIVQEADEIIDAHKLFKSLPSYNLLAKVIVYFPMQMTSEVFKRERNTAFMLIFGYGFIDIFIIGRKYGTPIVDSYTFFPYEDQNCAEKVHKIELLHSCEFSVPPTFGRKPETFYDIYDLASDDRNIYIKQLRDNPKKLPNYIPNCVIPVTVSNREPFVVADDIHEKVYKGIEFRMMNETFNEMQAIVKYRIQQANVRYRKFSLNNLTGAYADLLNK